VGDGCCRCGVCVCVCCVVLSLCGDGQRKEGRPGVRVRGKDDRDTPCRLGRYERYEERDGYIIKSVELATPHRSKNPQLLLNRRCSDCAPLPRSVPECECECVCVG
jgi:hypothetical protein